MKVKKLPNRTDIPIDIPNVKLENNRTSYSYPKQFTFTASSIPSDWLKDLLIGDKPIEYISETTTSKDVIKADLRLKAKRLLDKPFSAANAYNQFGSQRFPNAKVQCNKCGNMVEYIVDFFIHCILDHGTSLQDTEIAFQRVLERI